MGQLYFGDNLGVLRDHVADESVDLVYLDPPFNSNANYNILFKSPAGISSDSQIEAFEDTWRYGPEAAQAFHEVVTSGNTDVANLLRAMQEFLGQNDMMAYLAMMAARLIELHRVLKPTGSLYLHCDPTASHYLKLLLDAVFGANNFRSEVVWKRTSSHNSARRWGPIHDIILFYSKSDAYAWNRVFTPYDEDYTRRYYRHTERDGRRYRLSDLTGSGTRNGESGRPWNGFDPTTHGRHWGIPTVVKEEFGDLGLTPHGWLDLFHKHGLIEMTGEGAGWPHVAATSIACRAKLFRTSSTTFRPCQSGTPSGWATRPRSRWRFWSELSRHRPTPAMSFSTPFAVAARLYTPRRTSTAGGSAST